jgi:hypothetical protein
MSKPVWLVYNGYGDAVICNTRKQADQEAEDIDTYRSFFFSTSAKEYICLIMKCTSLSVAKDRIESMAKMRAERSSVSYF